MVNILYIPLPIVLIHKPHIMHILLLIDPHQQHLPLPQPMPVLLPLRLPRKPLLFHLRTMLLPLPLMQDHKNLLHILQHINIIQIPEQNINNKHMRI